MHTASNTWVADHISDGFRATPSDLYVACLYWAITTVTTIGYGDAANPTNTAERSVAMFGMLIGCGMWAYVLGAVTAKVERRV